jgi:hypothetical protein
MCRAWSNKSLQGGTLTRYDPEITPNPREWLALDEQERIKLAQAYHRAARVKVPNAKAHAVFHAIIENQIAERLASVVRAMARLMKEGLSRHDALHAISSVLAEHLFELMKTEDESLVKSAQARYDAAVERLTAKEWRQQYGS